MKGARMTAAAVTVVFILIAAVFCIWYSTYSGKRDNRRNVAVNRINSEIERSGAEPGEYIESAYAGWKAEYGKDCPDTIKYTPAADNGGDVFLSADNSSSVVCVIYRGGRLAGAVSYGFGSKGSGTVILAAAAAFAACLTVFAAAWIYIYRSVLKPFHELSDYPERLAKSRTAGRLPESRSRYFGKYIWGMNMLADRMEQDRKHIGKLEYQRQTLLASIAHGVKTPVANIRLYASAIMTGLYSDTSSDSEIAEKIDANAGRISDMVTEMLETSATSLSDYEPELRPFRFGELKAMIEKELSDRIRLARVPFTVDCTEDTLINSDKWGLFRVIAQLIENALKYGDGTGMTVTMQRQDDGFCITVRNKGALLPEREMPYIFKSYWRGSNASGKEGSGIGLYVAHEIVKKLGGTLMARALADTSEMEFMIYLEE